jgi:hypothetical protein
VIFSNKLTNELSRFEEARRRGNTFTRLALMIVPPVVLAIMVVFPMLELLTHTNRLGL